VAYHFVHNMQLLKAFWGFLLPRKQNVETGLMWKMTWFVHCHALNLEHDCALSNNKQAQPSHWLQCTLCCKKLLLFVCISALCICNSCHIGEAVQLMGYRPRVSSLIRSHVWKTENSPSLTPLLLHIFIKRCYTCFNQNYVLRHTHNVKPILKSSQALKILSAGNLWPAGL